jgi:hypothetical protein
VRVRYGPPFYRECKLMGKLPDSKPGLERSNRSTPAILCQEDLLGDHGIAAGASGFQPDDAGSTPADRSILCAGIV